jgi:hypothetical protein
MFVFYVPLTPLSGGVRRCRPRRHPRETQMRWGRNRGLHQAIHGDFQKLALKWMENIGNSTSKHGDFANEHWDLANDNSKRSDFTRTSWRGSTMAKFIELTRITGKLWNIFLQMNGETNIYLRGSSTSKNQTHFSSFWRVSNCVWWSQLI